MSVNHPLALSTDSTVELGQLSGESLIIPARSEMQDEINNWFNRISEERNIFCLYNTISCIIPLVEDNIGVAICPESVRYTTNPQKLCYRRIVNPEHLSNLLMVRRCHQVLPAATDCFWEFAESAVPTGSGRSRGRPAHKEVSGGGNDRWIAP